ncbi:hypothetical protein DLM76_06605 [Leptospira yasudae]|uniref:LIC_10190 family membrane protein n=1 Tax=Leptospira yasudae TaxID=2202201 RepID=UPI000E59BF73|nr:hypothetical protein [Leptospira yasudae]RHX94999.1 hypothetical protein DLM76_06605 [Leptospira yasudae]
MLAILISSTLSLYLFISFGTVVEKITKIKIQFTDRIFIGLAVTNTFVSFLSLFFPISGSVLLIFLVFGSIILYFSKERLKSPTNGPVHKIFVIILAAPIILIALIFSLNPPLAYDSGLYHIQSIKWIEEYSAVPGLAHIHGRIGFNPNVFTVFALTSLMNIFNQEIFSVNFTIYSVLVLHYISKIREILKQEGFTNLFLLNLIVFVAILDQITDVSSPTPDLISIVFPLYILTNLPRNTSINADLNLKDYIPTIILSTYTISVKLATIPLFLLVLILIVNFRKERGKLFWISSSVTLILLPWLIRNLILTGYLIYPFPSLDLFNFDWKLPIGEVISEKSAITGWARNPGEGYYEASQMNLQEWFPIWWKKITTFYRFLFSAAICFPLFAFILNFFKKIKLDFQTSVILFVSWVGVMFWICIAPDLRFGRAFLTIAAISPLFYLNFKIDFLWIRVPKYLSKGIVVLFLILTFSLLMKGKVYARSKRFIAENYTLLLLPRKIEVPQNLEFKIIKIKHLEFFIPVEGDRCFDHKIPCMPYTDYSFTLRGFTLQSGFKSVRN